MEGIEQNAQGRLGVSMLDTETGLALGWRQDERFAMCSTFKLLLAGWMLSLVDQGREKLDGVSSFSVADSSTKRNKDEPGDGWLRMPRHHGRSNRQVQVARCTSTSAEKNDTKSTVS
ncbi:serine hydrolase [Acidovorax temperans]|nr:serine hydrolase [Acidovorax temperans]WCT26503.1 serine hydrolase [Acidovorax temperans]